MPLTVRYTDTRNQHEATCDPIQEKAIRSLILEYLAGPWPFNDQYNLIHIDLSDESVETVNCYRKEDCIVASDRIVGARLCSFGGAIAWNIYRAIATIWPEINYHTSGRPAVIL